jgi:hypothetical protein
VERKNHESRERSHQERTTGAPGAETGGDIERGQHSLITDARKCRAVPSVRDESSGRGKKTAVKWNQ